ncbi:MAG: DUF2905 domain-containing protein [Candidatus Omnitrophica bacterium]|nr:DUF2905 domain-containing protein [Candidatus Omnitrophota bacterium]
MREIARMLIMVGVVSLLAGGIFYAVSLFESGKLPGDIVFSGKKVTVYIPIASCIVASLVLTLLLNLFFKSH